jgi:hypothetical protein
VAKWLAPSKMVVRITVEPRSFSAFSIGRIEPTRRRSPVPAMAQIGRSTIFSMPFWLAMNATGTTAARRSGECLAQFQVPRPPMLKPMQ